jgi:hypothetical protein
MDVQELRSPRRKGYGIGRTGAGLDVPVGTIYSMEFDFSDAASPESKLRKSGLIRDIHYPFEQWLFVHNLLGSLYSAVWSGSRYLTK